MNGELNFITLVALIVAAVAFLKLRSVLGHRNNEDDARIERLKTRERDLSKGPSGSGMGEVINMPRRDAEQEPVAAAAAGSLAVDAETRVKSYAAIDNAVTEGLLDIARFDHALDPDAFLTGARQAYEMIVSAFAEGNRKTLKDLLSREVYEGFSTAIADRESRGEKVNQQFVGINRSEIVEAETKGGIASITVRFVSQLITATLDKAGEQIAGDPQKIKEVTDIWTFSRDVSSKRALENLNWKLVATQAPN
jgi:predicted lipid-binding transport protein (Tim44 family)